MPMCSAPKSANSQEAAIMTSPLQMLPRALAVAAFACLAGCATAPQHDSRLSRLDQQMQAAYGDKYTAEYGHADLARAELSLAAAHKSVQRGRDSEAQHEMTMAEGYIDLGSIHGRQERTKMETASLNTQQDKMRLASRDRELAAAKNDTMQAELATDAATQKLAAMREQLRVYDVKMTELGATLVLRDVMFDTGSATLRAGADNRLAPLITYLRSSPTTTVRIEGHTDNTGTSAHNDDLSLDRANAVARAIGGGAGGGTVTNAMQTYGFGQSKPIASNATVSGREQNRRVEITLN
jgi:outer membrane protein OmpA-like peptidoglycan-associated protein